MMVHNQALRTPKAVLHSPRLDSGTASAARPGGPWTGTLRLAVLYFLLRFATFLQHPTGQLSPNP